MGWLFLSPPTPPIHKYTIYTHHLWLLSFFLPCTVQEVTLVVPPNGRMNGKTGGKETTGLQVHSLIQPLSPLSYTVQPDPVGSMEESFHPKSFTFHLHNIKGGKELIFMNPLYNYSHPKMMIGGKKVGFFVSYHRYSYIAHLQSPTPLAKPYRKQKVLL